jgi:DNA repair exonuclease SbcCD ATPase subunit
MKTTSKEIEKELDQTTKRLDELTEMRTGITTNLQTLQAGFIGGKTSLDELQAEQTRLTILNESIKALEAKQDESHAAFQKASLSESRHATLKQMKVIAGEAETAFNEYVELRAAFGETIKENGEKMFDAVVAFRDKQREFQRAFSELAPGVDALRFVPAEMRESFNQTKKELEQIGFLEKDFHEITKEHLRLPPIVFEENVRLIEQFIGAQRAREKKKARQAAGGGG